MTIDGERLELGDVEMRAPPIVPPQAIDADESTAAAILARVTPTRRILIRPPTGFVFQGVTTVDGESFAVFVRRWMPSDLPIEISPVAPPGFPSGLETTDGPRAHEAALVLLGAQAIGFLVALVVSLSIALVAFLFGEPMTARALLASVVAFAAVTWAMTRVLYRREKTKRGIG